MTVVVTPLTASRKDRCKLASRSWPRCRPTVPPRARLPRRPRRPPRPKMLPSRSPRSSTRKLDAEARRARPPVPPPKGLPAGPESADLVVLLALGRVAEHVVGGRDLLEAVLGARVGVGVVLLGQLAVGLADLLVGRRVGHPEHLVVVLLEPLTLGCHGRSPPHFHHGRPQDPPLPAVPGPHDLDDLLAGRPVARLVGDGVVEGGVERPTDRGRCARGPPAPARAEQRRSRSA